MNIYSAKFMNEATATLADKVFKKPVSETYLFSTLNMLREMNSVINKNTKDMYIHIAEASSKEDENKIFADYFYQFKNIFQEFSNKIQEMKSRMIISVENKIETWEDLIKDDAFIAGFDKEFSYSGWEFHHIEESDYPRLNLQKMYQKEFDYLGHLMQDNSIDASPSAKMKIIATVSNNFGNCACDKSWVKSLIKNMVDVDEKEVSRSYSECIYNSLRDKYDFNVDKGLLYTCKENLVDYHDAVEAACALCDDLLADLDKVAENIASYLFRNNDKKLKIKTDTDGILDRDYRLDTYSMNQLNLFLKNKINQIRKILNVYSIAIGIKFDTVVDFIDQNVDILRMAKEYNSDVDVNSDEDNDDNDMIDAVENDEVEDSEEDTTSDEIESAPEDDDFDMDDESEEEPTEEEPESEESIQEEEPSEDSEEDDTVDYEGEEFEEAYIFEAELFELEMMQESYNMHQAVRTALLLEEEGEASTNVEKLAEKANTWQKIVSKLIALWKKFKEAVLVNSKNKIEYLKKNQQIIETGKVKGKVKLSYGVGTDINKLGQIKIPDLNYQALEKDLVDAETFCKAHFNDYYEEGKSISESIKEKLLGKPYEDLTDIAQVKPSVKEAYDFCVKYPDKIDPIKRQTDIMDKAQRVAKNVSNVQESVVNNDYMQYFSEMEAEVSEEDKKENEANKGGGDKSAKLTVYFKVCSQVLAAEMTVYQKWFNELYKFCVWYIKQAGGKGNAEGSEGEQKTEESFN